MVDESLHCNSMCIYADRSATCTNRVLWGASREFVGEQRACDLAYGLVLEQCPVCSLCLLRDSGCDLAKLPETALPYECTIGLSDWEDVWDEAKIKWCCKNHGLGCHSDQAEARTTYNCTADHRSWTASQAGWCCKHKGTGCSVKTYSCAEKLSWESWSDDQKDWCYQNTNFSSLHSCGRDEKNWGNHWHGRPGHGPCGEHYAGEVAQPLPASEQRSGCILQCAGARLQR